jgi:hypothetical protein
VGQLPLTLRTLGSVQRLHRGHVPVRGHLAVAALRPSRSTPVGQGQDRPPHLVRVRPARQQLSCVPSHHLARDRMHRRPPSAAPQPRNNSLSCERRRKNAAAGVATASGACAGSTASASAPSVTPSRGSSPSRGTLITRHAQRHHAGGKQCPSQSCAARR